MFVEKHEQEQSSPFFNPPTYGVGATNSGNRIARIETTARTRFLAKTFVFHSHHFLFVFVSHSGDFSTHWSREKSANETPALFRSSDELAHAKFDQIDHANCPL
jgi:hypothetical protein